MGDTKPVIKMKSDRFILSIYANQQQLQHEVDLVDKS